MIGWMMFEDVPGLRSRHNLLFLRILLYHAIFNTHILHFLGSLYVGSQFVVQHGASL